MKVLFVALCAITVAIAALSFRLPQSEVKYLKQVHETCQANGKTYCNENILRKLVNHQNYKEVGAHMLCMAEKAGLMKHGQLVWNTIKTKITLGCKPGSDISKLMHTCVIPYMTPEFTAVRLWICFAENDIHYYHRL